MVSKQETSSTVEVIGNMAYITDTNNNNTKAIDMTGVDDDIFDDVINEYQYELHLEGFRS